MHQNESTNKCPGPVPELINLHDEAALQWFFGRGSTVFERSTFGAMLDRLDKDAHTSTPCTLCEGAGILEEGGFAIKKVGDDFDERTVEHGGWCPRCRGTGFTPVRTRKSKEALTARPSKPPIEGGGEAPDDTALTRYAVTSRRLSTVERSDPEAIEVLAAYYGDAGCRWGRTRHGRLFAVYALTPAGCKLIKMALEGRQDAIEMSDHERIGVAAELEQTQPKRQRRALLDAAAVQALELVRKAAVAWNAAKPARTAA
jgi:hypothetical protein